MRPVCKTTDRAVVRELFRREFYGSHPQPYPDDGLWEIYDSMETHDAYGPYLVFHRDHVLFLLEVHPPLQMDLTVDYLSQPGTIGIYCFYSAPGDPLNLPALRTIIAALLDYRSIRRIVTRINFVAPDDPRVVMLEKTGFRRLPQSPNTAAIYLCSADSFPNFSRNTRHHLQSVMD